MGKLKIRVVMPDPETRDDVTTSFNTIGELLTWATEQLEKEKEKSKNAS